MKIHPSIPLAAIGLFLPLASSLEANPLYWNPASPPATWDSTALHWSLTEAGPGAVNWTAGVSNPTVAAFGGSGSVVTVSANLSAGGVRFLESGYTLTGSSDFRLNTVSGVQPAIDVATGKNATISGADFRLIAPDKRITKTGEGTLTLGAGKNMFADSGTPATGAMFRILGGEVIVTGGMLKNAQTIVEVASGTKLTINGDTISVGGLTGAGTITSSNQILITGQGGAGANFSGVLTSASALTKANGAGTQVLSGSSANALTGTVTVAVGTLAFAKTGNVAAYSGNLIVLGNASTASVSPILRLDGENQISTAANVTFVSGNRATTKLDLNGHSTTLGTLTVGLPYAVTPGKSQIDFGINSNAQTLTFSSMNLATSATPLLEVLNFNFGLDTLRFVNDPNSQLARMTINGLGGLYATQSGGYWNVYAVPEPGSMALALITGGAWLLWRRRRVC